MGVRPQPMGPPPDPPFSPSRANASRTPLQAAATREMESHSSSSGGAEGGKGHPIMIPPYGHLYRDTPIGTAPWWGQFGVTMRTHWGHSGVISRSTWGHFGVTMLSIWGHYGDTLGSLWGH